MVMHAFKLLGLYFVSALLSGELLAEETRLFTLTSLEYGSRQGPERFSSTDNRNNATKPCSLANGREGSAWGVRVRAQIRSICVFSNKPGTQPLPEPCRYHNSVPTPLPGKRRLRRRNESHQPTRTNQQHETARRGRKKKMAARQRLALPTDGATVAATPPMTWTEGLRCFLLAGRPR